MHFIDAIIAPQAGGMFTTKVYRKQMHTGLHLQGDSHHNLASKYSVINILSHRVKPMGSNPQQLQEEIYHLGDILMKCTYRKLAINKVLSR